MEVLLISPLDPDVPTNLKFLMGGENTYTKTLLECPPKGVKYTHWQDALKNGQIEYTSWRRPLNLLIKARILPLNPGILCLKLNKSFDLIHCHVYNLRLGGQRQPPVVLSDSSANFLFLKDYVGWGRLKLAVTYTLKKLIVKTLDVYDQELNLEDAPLVVWSKFAKKVHVGLGQDPKKISVIPPGLPLPKKPELRITNYESRINILFIGVWFKRKGGEILLKAYNSLKKKHPDIKLTIVGQVPSNVSLPKEVIRYSHLQRERLLSKVFPYADVLVLVPPKAEGYGLVVLEAATFGIPSVVTPTYALPELVEHGKTGFMVKKGDPEKLAEALEKLIANPGLRKKMGEESLKQFKQKFWIKETNKKLLKVYKRQLRE